MPVVGQSWDTDQPRAETKMDHSNIDEGGTELSGGANSLVAVWSFQKIHVVSALSIRQVCQQSMSGSQCALQT